MIFTTSVTILFFDAMMRLYEKRRPVDLLTLTDELKKKMNLKRLVVTAYLTELTNYVPTAAHAETYAEIVAKRQFVADH